MLLTRQDPCPIGDLRDLAFDRVSRYYRFDDLSEQQLVMLHSTIDTDVTIALAALYVLGAVIVDQTAGTAGLTDLGRSALRRLRGLAEPGGLSAQPGPPGGPGGYGVGGLPPARVPDRQDDYDPARFDVAASNAAVAAV